MRELLYLSTAKLDALRTGAGLRALGDVEFEVSLLGFKVKAAPRPGAAAGAIPWQRLKAAEKALKSARDIAARPDVPVGEWFTFRAETAAELPARWLGDARVALFACQYATPPGAEKLVVLLCGSARHLIGGSDDDGGGGSVPDESWFAEDERDRELRWRDVDAMRSGAEHERDAGLDERVRGAIAVAERGDEDADAALWTTYALHRGVTRRIGPHRRLVLSGHARVLVSGLIGTGEGEPLSRVVLATPLFVEYAH